MVTEGHHTYHKTYSEPILQSLKTCTFILMFVLGSEEINT